jgi:hypothetical protein
MDTHKYTLTVQNGNGKGMELLSEGGGEFRQEVRSLSLGHREEISARNGRWVGYPTMKT